MSLKVVNKHADVGSGGAQVTANRRPTMFYMRKNYDNAIMITGVLQ